MKSNIPIAGTLAIIAALAVWLTGCGGSKRIPAAKVPASDHAMPSKDAHGEHGGHENMQMNIATPRRLVVGSDPAEPQAGSTTKLVLQIQDEDGTPIKKFDVLHEKLVHLIVVRAGLDEFAHLHPEVDASGMITVDYVFPKSGKYRLFADHQPKGKTPGLAAGELDIAGDDEPGEALEPNNSNLVTVGEIKALIVIKPGDQKTSVRFQFVDATNHVISDMQPYLGAMGHLAIISADGREYVHAHPLSEAQTAPDGAIEFAAHFPKPGIYKAWGEFRRGGSVLTVPFVMEHKSGQSMPNAGRD